MPNFTYKAKDGKGKLLQGAMEADSRIVVTNRLQAMGYFPIDVRADESKKKKAEGFGGFFQKRIKTKDITSMNRQMADLIAAGIPLVKALTIITNQTPNESLKEIISRVSSDVQGGDTLALAMSRHPRIFSKLYCAMVRAGEIGGMLDSILERLADFAEVEEEIRGKIKAALAYPVVMVVAGIGAIVVLMTVVIPRILKIFSDLHQTLPLPTQILISILDFVKGNWYFLVGGLAIAVIAFWRFIKTEEGKLLWHTFQLRIPIIGDLVKKQQVARFARTLGSLLKNGVSILNSLEIVKEVMSNRIVKDEMSRVSDAITQGSGIAAPLRDSKVFPPVVVNMISIGEETGRLPDVLLRVAASYEMEVDRSVKTMTSLIEPLIILGMGLVVAFVVISMLLPIFTLDPTGGM